MNNNDLDLAIEHARDELDGRETRRRVGWFIISALLFVIPAYLFFTMTSGSVYETSYAGVVLVWLIVALGVGNALAAALFTPRTIELRLALATATAVRSMVETDAPTGVPSDSRAEKE